MSQGLLLIGAALLVASPTFAQRNLNPIGNNGNILHPGIPMSGPPARSNSGRGNDFARGRSGFAPRTLVVPYPVYSGDPFYYGYTGSNFWSPPPGAYDPIWGAYNPGPGYGGGAVLSQSPQPTVIINQNFQPDTVHPVLHDYTNVSLPQPGTLTIAPASSGPAVINTDQQIVYLIAVKDHTIYPAIAYWVLNGTLNYISPTGVQSKIALDQVDRDFSAKLNDDRQVQFTLPAAK